MTKHSYICPTSATDDEYDCVCVYIESERERLIAQITAIGEREYHGGDYEYFYGVDALLEELSKDDR